MLASIVTVMRVSGRMAAMDDEGPAWIEPSPLVDGGEVLPTAFALGEDGTPPARGARLEDGHEATRLQFEPALTASTTRAAADISNGSVTSSGTRLPLSR